MATTHWTIEDPLTGQHLTFLETAADTEGRSVRAEVRLEPGGFVPRHLHLRQDERLEVLAGSVRFRSRGEDRVLESGDTCVISRRRLHRSPTRARGGQIRARCSSHTPHRTDHAVDVRDTGAFSVLLLNCGDPLGPDSTLVPALCYELPVPWCESRRDDHQLGRPRPNAVFTVIDRGLAPRRAQALEPLASVLGRFVASAAARTDARSDKRNTG